MRIMHLLQSTQFSGAENVVTQIMNMFEDDGTYEMYYVSPYGPIEETIRSMGINYYGIRALKFKCVKAAIKSIKPDIIHAHDVSASVIAMLTTLGSKIQVISHMHVNHENMSRLNLKTGIYIVSSLKYKHIFWVSQSSFDNYLFNQNLRNKSTVLLNVINKEKILKKILLDHKIYKYDISYVGRLTYQKNPERLVNVLKLASEQMEGLKIAIVGDGDLFELTKNLVGLNGLQGQVDLLGFVNNPYKILQGSKVMLMTSRFEGLPVTALEAMALGIPIVSTPVDGLVDIVKPGENGFLEFDDFIIAKKLCEIIRNDDLRNKLSNGALAKFNDLNNIHAYKSEISKAYSLSGAEKRSRWKL